MLEELYSRISELEMENSGLANQIHEMETDLINLKNKLEELDRSTKPVRDFVLGDWLNEICNLYERKLCLL